MLNASAAPIAVPSAMLGLNGMNEIPCGPGLASADPSNIKTIAVSQITRIVS